MITNNNKLLLVYIQEQSQASRALRMGKDMAERTQASRKSKVTLNFGIRFYP